MSFDKPTLWVVPCIDTEGPLEETIDATFERLKNMFGIEIEPSIKNLDKLQNTEIDFGGLEQKIATAFSKERLAYLSTWREVEEMVRDVTSEEYRFKFKDPSGNPLVFSWFIIDVIGYKSNPRRKAVGYHTVWDQYQRLLKETIDYDAFGWHFHTVPVNQNPLEYNPCWTNNDYHEQSICRRLIERNFFPSIFRAGGVIERNDLNYWLEQFIPFDYSCHSLEKGFGGPGCLSDWRNAPLSWRGYHPNFYDYRKEGSMNRLIFRCLDTNTPNCKLSKTLIETAFKEAQIKGSAILSYFTHDRRDMRPDFEFADTLIRDVATNYADVNWQYTHAINAAQQVKNLNQTSSNFQFNLKIEDSTLWIHSNQKIFGSIPFLGIEEASLFYRTNPTIEGNNSWAYKLNKNRNYKNIAVAASSANGHVSINKIRI